MLLDAQRNAVLMYTSLRLVLQRPRRHRDDPGAEVRRPVHRPPRAARRGPPVDAFLEVLAEAQLERPRARHRPRPLDTQVLPLAPPVRATSGIDVRRAHRPRRGAGSLRRREHADADLLSPRRPQGRASSASAATGPSARAACTRPRWASTAPSAPSPAPRRSSRPSQLRQAADRDLPLIALNVVIYFAGIGSGLRPGRR